MEDLPWLADFTSRPGGRARGAAEHSEGIRSASSNPAIRRSNWARLARPTPPPERPAARRFHKEFRPNGNRTHAGEFFRILPELPEDQRPGVRL